MKKILLIVFAVILFVGCSPLEKVLDESRQESLDQSAKMYALMLAKDQTLDVLEGGSKFALDGVERDCSDFINLDDKNIKECKFSLKENADKEVSVTVSVKGAGKLEGYSSVHVYAN